MKSLKTVQTISKVLGILVKIGFIFTIIGATGSLVGGSALLTIPYLGENLIKLIVSEAGSTNATELGIALISECVYLVGVAIATGFTCSYFKKELADGTPFTHSGADKLKKVGIINLVAPFGTYCISAGIISMAEVSEYLISNEYEIVTGVAMILLSFVFHYGADLIEGECNDVGTPPMNNDYGMNESETAETVSTMTITDII